MAKENFKCEQCNGFEEKTYQFNNDIPRCEYCMSVEGLCIDCGNYIPFPEDENDELNILSDSSDYAPAMCLDCFKKLKS